MNDGLLFRRRIKRSEEGGILNLVRIVRDVVGNVEELLEDEYSYSSPQRVPRWNSKVVWNYKALENDSYQWLLVCRRLSGMEEGGVDGDGRDKRMTYILGCWIIYLLS